MRILWLLLCVSPVFAEWKEVRSEHFRVITDSSVKKGREVVHRFEQIRAVFRDQFPTLRLESGKELIILAVKDDVSFQELLLNMKAQAAAAGGIFMDTEYFHYVVLRLDTRASSLYEVAFHEYAHLVFNLNYDFFPLWLNEGMAEFYSQVEIHRKKIKLGVAKPISLAFLQRRGFLDIKDLLRTDNVFSHDPSNANVARFYAQSWLLVHYLQLSKDAQANQYFPKLLKLLSQGVPSEVALRNVLGDTKQINDRLTGYLKSGRFPHFEIKLKLKREPNDYPAQVLSPAQALGVIGAFQAITQEYKAPQDVMDIVSAGMTESGVAVNLATMYQRAGDGEGFERAVLHARIHNKDNWLPPYMASKRTLGDTKIELLEKANALAPDLARPLLELGNIYRDTDKAKSLAYAEKAIKAQPGSEAARLNYTELLFENGKLEQATRSAQSLVHMARADFRKRRALELLEKIDRVKNSGLSSDQLQTKEVTLDVIFNRDVAYQTRLLNALWTDKPNEAKALLTNPASLKERSFFNESALHLAAERNHAELIPALVAGGLSPADTDEAGFTPLMLAASKGHREALIALVDAGSPLDVGDENGTTALMWAAMGGHTAVVKLLISAKCDRNAKDQFTRTAFDYVARHEHKDLYRLMQMLRMPLSGQRLSSRDREDYRKARLEAMSSLWNNETPTVETVAQPNNLLSKDRKEKMIIFGTPKESARRELNTAIMMLGDDLGDANLPEAERRLITALKRYPSAVPLAYYHLGRIYKETQNYQASHDVYEAFLNTSYRGWQREEAKKALAYLKKKLGK